MESVLAVGSHSGTSSSCTDVTHNATVFMIPFSLSLSRVCVCVKVILITGISYGAMLSDKFGLPVISDVGGIPPGKW